jgi:transposase
MRTKGTPKELQQRRFQAIALLQAGHRPSEAAKILGVSPSSISQWKKIYQRDGPEALKARPHPGPKPKLTGKQREKLARLLLKGPRRHGYATDLWTLRRVVEVIQRCFGVSYDISGVWHVLQAMGWSCQKPERHARERDEDAIACWRKQDWPRIKKSP